MPVQKIVHFSILIKIDGRLREFNFRKRSESQYDGDTSDERGNRCTFKWHNQGEDWILEPDSKEQPSWIKNNVTVIKEAFLTELL
ncbi:MAG: hypothetical protein ACO1NW_11870 [Chitinophagaceae bacterium]